MHPGEKFNTLSHLLAAIVAIPGLIYLVVLAAATSDPWKIISVAIYGVTLVLLFISSTLCHGHSGKHEKFFEKMDHLSIYLLISGTYTPYLLVTLRGVWGWSMFSAVWGLAVIGMIVDVWPKDQATENKRIIPLIIYLLMGWIAVIPLKPLAVQLALDCSFALEASIIPLTTPS